MAKVDDEDGWIEGVLSDAPPSLPDQPRDDSPPTVADLVSSLDDKGLKVLEMFRAGSSQNEIQREVFGFTGGAAFNKVSEIVRRYKAATSTTTPDLLFQGAAGQ